METITLVKDKRTVSVNRDETTRMEYMLRHGWKEKRDRNADSPAKFVPRQEGESEPLQDYSHLVFERLTAMQKEDPEGFEELATAIIDRIDHPDEYENEESSGLNVREDGAIGYQGIDATQLKADECKDATDEGEEVKGNVPNPTEAESVKPTEDETPAKPVTDAPKSKADTKPSTKGKTPTKPKAEGS